MEAECQERDMDSRERNDRRSIGEETQLLQAKFDEKLWDTTTTRIMSE